MRGLPWTRSGFGEGWDEEAVGFKTPVSVKWCGINRALTLTLSRWERGQGGRWGL